MPTRVGKSFRLAFVVARRRRNGTLLAHSGTRAHGFPDYRRDMAKASTPWGAGEVLEELTVPQRAGEKRFATIVQLLADARGEELVRFAYSTGGTARRGPVTLRARDLERLRGALAESPGLARALALGSG
jgi:hypothetical protein